MKVQINSCGRGLSVVSTVEMSIENFAYLCKMIGKSNLRTWYGGANNHKPFFAVGNKMNICTYYTAIDKNFAEIWPLVLNA